MKSFVLMLCLMPSAYTGLSIKKTITHTYKNINQNTMQQDTLKKPMISIEKTFVKPMQVLLISDTGRVPDLSTLFENDYAELYKFIFSNHLTPGLPMAFHLNYENPMRLEIAVPVNEIPNTLTGRIRSKSVEGGNAVVLHYTGSYEEMGTAYNILGEWIKQHGLQSKGLSFEVYINDPSSVKSKGELKTDIYQLIQ